MIEEVVQLRDSLDSVFFRAFLSDEETILEKAFRTMDWKEVTSETICMTLSKKKIEVAEVKDQVITDFCREGKEKC